MPIDAKRARAMGVMLCATVAVGEFGCDPSSGSTPETPAAPTNARSAAVQSAAVQSAGAEASAAVATASAPAGVGEPALSEEAADSSLAIRLEITPNIEHDRVPMHVVKLHLRNVSNTDPVVVFMPGPEFIRFGTSWLTFRAADAAHFSAPRPRPHGYSVTESDFHRLEPLASKTFEQRFTLDPMARGGGDRSERRKGFEAGTSVTVAWTYANKSTKWPGGAKTMDGVTKPLFGGQDIPHLYTGRLVAELSWTAPK
jgi:hypothetical protein